MAVFTLTDTQLRVNNVDLSSYMMSATTNVTLPYETTTLWPAYATGTSSGNIQYVYRLPDGQEWVSPNYPAQTISYAYQPFVNEWVYEPAPVISQEEADRRLRETRERQHIMAIRRKRAERKGKRLLVGMLSETQKWEYAKTGTFTVCGADGELYVLRKGRTVHQLGKNGQPEWSHCIHLSYSYIDEDSLIALKLLLETDPANFHRVANSTRLTPGNMSTRSLERATARAGASMVELATGFRHLSSAAEAARRSMEELAPRLQVLAA